MKKFHSILIFFMALWPLVTFAQVDEWDGTALQWTQGSGTEADPYLIQSAEHLAKLAQNVNSGTTYSGQYFKLTTNLNLKNRQWTPIGTSETNSFQGNFDGNNHFIDSLYYNGTSYRVGLFGCIKNATLTQINVNANIRRSSSNAYAGGICGYASGTVTISDCENSGNVSSSSNYSSSYAGGICGYASGTVTISGCSNSGDVSSSSSSSYNNVCAYAGGICGYASGTVTISDCSNSGDVSSSSYAACAGGICGYAKTESGTVTISDCSNSGDVSSSSYSYAGGICGYANASSSGTVTISNCENSGTISSSYDAYAGGICGYANASSSGTVTISDCSNSGDVSSSYSSSYAGGICGYANASSSGTVTISNCENSGTISSSYNAYAGGICGYANASSSGTVTISNCENSGDVSSSSSAAYAGGICGYASGTVTISGCSNSGDVSSSSSSSSNCPSSYAGGICGYANTSSGTITISNCENSGDVSSFSSSSYNSSSSSYAGGICGYASGTITISGCSNSGDVSFSSSSSYNNNTYAGGICGYANTESGTVTISGCSNSGDVSSSSSSAYAGGICGSSSGTISNCENSGNITSYSQFDSGVYAGGICGASSKNISDCSNSGTITSTSNRYSCSGGICGRFTASSSVTSVSDCLNFGDVSSSSSNSSSYAGGIYGSAAGGMVISGCSNFATINAYSPTSASYSSGICSYTEGAVTISSCSNFGDVSSSTNTAISSYSGGICSYASGTTTISVCSNSGTIISYSDTSSYAGGIYSRLYGSIVNCYNVGDIIINGTEGEAYGIGGLSARNCYNAGSLTGTLKVGCALSFINCYYLDTCGAFMGGTPKPESIMTNVFFHTLLNTDSVVYRMDITPNINKGYPIFGSGTYVQTGEADNIYGSSAILHGNYYAESVTAVGFEYKSIYDSTFTKVYTTASTPVSYSLTNLEDEMIYNFRLFIEKDSATYYGVEKQFIILHGGDISNNERVTICQGESYNFYGQILTASGVYTHVFPFGAGNDSIITLTLTVSPLPNVNITGNTNICEGESTTLTATGASNYVWSNGVSGATNTISSFGYYTVTATSAKGCSSTASATVIIHSLPVITISGDTEFCEGRSTALTASGANTYIWSDGTNNATLDASTPGTYTVIGITTHGCSATESITISMNNASYSEFSEIALGNYDWNGIKYTESGDYTQTFTAANGCDSIVTLHLTITTSITDLHNDLTTERDNIRDDFIDYNITYNKDFTTDITQYAQAANIEVWPNPAQTVCNISCSIAQAELRLYDAIGRCVSRAKAESEITPIDVTSFAPGIYILHVVSDGKTIATKKVVVKR